MQVIGHYSGVIFPARTWIWAGVNGLGATSEAVNDAWGGVDRASFRSRLINVLSVLLCCSFITVFLLRPAGFVVGCLYIVLRV